MINLIDADLVAYRCAATVTEDMDKDIAFYRMDVLIQQILEATSVFDYKLYLTGPTNFRKKINPEYKANRKDTVPPIYLKECKQYLRDEHKAITSVDCEADDLLGCNQTDETIICTLDKDLRMIPGKHYNWTKVELDTVNKQDGLRHFYKQMLIGDRSDNIFGVDKIGPVKAAKLIDHLDDEEEMIKIVWEKYDYDTKRFVMNANCLWIWREDKVLWGDRQGLFLPKDLRQEANMMSEYMTSLNLGISTEHITTETLTSGIQDNGTGTEAIV